MAEVGPGGTLTARCRRCGGGIEIDTQMVTNMVALGQPLVFEHAEGSCPSEAAPAAEPRPLRSFRLQLLAYEVDPEAGVPDRAFSVEVPGAELLAGTGTTVTAESFSKAVNGPMTAWLVERGLSSSGRIVSAWEKFQEQSVWADAAPTPAPTPQG